MRRIAIVIDPFRYPFNGTVVSTRRFVFALSKTFRFRLLAIDEGPASDDLPEGTIVPMPRLSIPGVNYLIDTMKVPLARPVMKRIRSALEEVDLLHVQFPFFLGFAALRVARKQGLPVICSFHVQPENVLKNLGVQSQWLVDLLYKLFLWAFYNQADHVVAPSEFAANELRVHGLRQPVTVISNGVPSRFFDLPVKVAGSIAGLPGEFLILSVGRLADEKHHDVIIQAIARCQDPRKISLVIVGNGPRESQLKALAARLSVNAKIGSLEDAELLDLYACCDLFVHAGEIELEGMAVLEAMAAACPVVIADAPGSAAVELIEPGPGRFVPGDVAALSRRIDAWREDDEARLEVGKQNRLLAAERSHDASTAQLAALYKSVIPARPP